MATQALRQLVAVMGWVKVEEQGDPVEQDRSLVRHGRREILRALLSPLLFRDQASWSTRAQIDRKQEARTTQRVSV